LTPVPGSGTIRFQKNIDDLTNTKSGGHPRAFRAETPEQRP
jgi:hypothetical protein